MNPDEWGDQLEAWLRSTFDASPDTAHAVATGIFLVATVLAALVTWWLVRLLARAGRRAR